MIWSIVGGAATLLFGGATLFSIGSTIASGDWKNWGVLDWLGNIGLTIMCLFPILSTLRTAAVAGSLQIGSVLGKLSTLPLIGGLFSKLYELVELAKPTYTGLMGKIFSKGGFFDRLGKEGGVLGKIKKHPWVTAGLLVSSTMFDSVLGNVFELWGNLSLKAGDKLWGVIDKLTTSMGSGNPMGELASVITSGKANLPPCVIQVWGALDSSTLIGMVITTLQYMFIVVAIRNGLSHYK